MFNRSCYHLSSSFSKFVKSSCTTNSTTTSLTTQKNVFVGGSGNSRCNSRYISNNSTTCTYSSLASSSSCILSSTSTLFVKSPSSLPTPCISSYSSSSNNNNNLSGTLKSKSYLLPTLKISKSMSFEETMNLLIQKISLAPLFYKNAPIVVDINDYADIDAHQFDNLFRICGQYGLIPIGIACQAPSSIVNELLSKVKLPLLPSSISSSSSSSSSTTTTSNTQPQQQNNHYSSSSQQQPQQTITKVVYQPPMIINQSIRSGQQIYAQNSDLIIMGNVHSGGEAVADGNIFVFGALKGRALAGLNGAPSKIICNKFQAELVSIANIYHACETMPRTVNPDLPTTISLQDGRLLFTSTDLQSNPLQQSGYQL